MAQVLTRSNQSEPDQFSTPDFGSNEAFLAGVPVITSNIGGMAELVEDGVNGLHFQMGNAADLARQLQRVIDDPALIAQLKKNVPPVTPIESHAL